MNASRAGALASWNAASPLPLSLHGAAEAVHGAAVNARGAASYVLLVRDERAPEHAGRRSLRFRTGPTAP